MSLLNEDDIKALEAIWNPDPQAAVQAEDPRRRSVFMHVGPNVAGVHVDEAVASQVGAVWACINVIAKLLSSSDWNVFEQVTPKRRKQLADTISYVLNTRPNPEMTAQSFRMALMISVLSWGNGYAEIIRDNANRVAELYPIHPDRVTPMRDGAGRLIYRIANPDGSETYLNPRDIFHIRGPSILGLVGDNVIAKASGTIALAIATQRFAQAYFGNGTQLGGIMEYPGELDDVTFERQSKAWDRSHKGPGKAFKTGWIEQGTKYHPIDSNAEKAQLVTARQQDIEDVCRWWGVPPHKVQHLLRSTNNNIEHQGLEFVRDCGRPWARELQQEADYKLFSDRGPKRFTLIDLDWASEGDFKSRMEGLQIGRNVGALNANEVREAIGYDDMGTDGDIYIVQGAMIPLDRVGDAYDPKGKPTASKPDDKDPAAAPLQNWAQSIFERASNYHRKRRAAMENAGREDAAKHALDEATTYIEDQLAVIVPHMRAWAGRDVLPALVNASAQVLENADPVEVAASLINTLKGET